MLQGAMRQIDELWLSMRNEMISTGIAWSLCSAEFGR